MKWLGIDFETTGLNTQQDRIIEVGCVLWDPEKKKPLWMYQSFIAGHKVSPEIEKLTGITQEDVDFLGQEASTVFKNLASLAKRADFIVAHNGTNFDRPILEAELKRLSIPPPNQPWIDTSLDVPYPAWVQTRKLKYLAADHNFLNPFSHRAVFDVMTMFSILKWYDPKEVMEWAKSPNVTIQALVDKERRQLAKDRGYRWDAQNMRWIKTIKQFQMDEEKKSAQFAIKELSL